MKQMYWYIIASVVFITPYLSVTGNNKESVLNKAMSDIPVRSESPVIGGISVFRLVQDTLEEAKLDTVVFYNADPTRAYLGVDTVALGSINTMPNVTLHQMLKGAASGVHVQETSGEPGTIKQNMIVRGISHPVLNARDFSKNSPLIIVNGVQMIDDPSIVYDIQDFEVQPIGAATNLASVFDLDNIESINVLKDYSTSAIYGPRAANGVIYITTKNAKPGHRKISVNSYSGFAATPGVTTINAQYLKEFRQPFYDAYATGNQIGTTLPYYLSDSSNVNFYGPSNWTDLYYRTTPVYSFNGSLDGGSDRSNFRVFAGHLNNTASADETRLQRYQTAFYINMLPTPWMTISSMIHLNRLDRGRSSSMAERLGETRFFPDLSTPLAPNKDIYRLYRDEQDNAIDKNVNNSLTASLNVNFRILPNLNYSPRFSMDYNENVRDVFWPSSLMSGTNYVSNYYGFNERIAFDNTITYDLALSNRQSILFQGGFNYFSDTQHYNYAVGYRGPNDFIKVNVVEGRSNEPDYLQAIGFIPYYYSDRILHKLVSLYGKATYSLGRNLQAGLLFRRDGSSAAQIDARWFNSYAIDASYDFAEIIGAPAVDHLKVFASHGRLGNAPYTDRYAAGPQYGSELGWEGNTSVFSYNGYGTISRPYNSGWIGYDLPWSYTNLTNVGFDLLVLNSLSARVELYDKHNKNMLFTIPALAESGYRYEVASGMSVQNQGVDVTLNYSLPKNSNQFGWNSSFNISYNVNKLTALPGGLDELVFGNNKLKVGERIDRFWLLENTGIYHNDLDVPVRASDYKVLTYNGTQMRGGDPRWTDMDGNFDINDDDRILMGNIFPKYLGGFYNQFVYRKFDLSFNLYFSIGKEILNQQAARYFDFVNQDEVNSLNTVKDITYWEKNFDDVAYPLYNPWSAVSPYQYRQNMFLEDGSFLRLRNLTLGYDLADMIGSGEAKKFERFYLYLSANNLFTYTKYSGRDPEVVNYYGIDNGLGIRIPQTYTLGLKLDF